MRPDRALTVAARAPRQDRHAATGSLRFVEDLRLPGCLTLAIVRSTQAHARLVRVELAGARSCPGVALVAAGADLRGSCRAGLLPLFPILAGGEVLAVQSPHSTMLEGEEVTHVGQPIALIAAERPGAARDAVEQVEIHYEPLVPVIDIDGALRSGAARVHTTLRDNIAFRWRATGGDVAGAFARADRVVRERIELPRVLPAPLETRGAAAQWDAGREELTVWSTTQTPHQVRAALAAILGIAEACVRVVSPDSGASFGAKIGLRVEEVLVAWAALRLAPRPVRWLEGRRESQVATRHGAGMVTSIEAAVREDGRLLALRCESFIDLGASCELLAPAVPTLLGALAAGAYDVPAVETGLVGVLTNKTPCGAWQGAGSAEAAVAVERLIDRLAGELELEVVEVRRSNFVRQFPHALATGGSYDSGSYAETLDRALELCDWPALRREVEGRRAAGEIAGLGLAACVAAGAQGPSRELGGPVWERASVRVVGPSSVEVATSVTSHGQGLEATLARIAAERLGIDSCDVRVVAGDTGRVPSGGLAAAGRTIAAGGAAVHEAARRVEVGLRQAAAAAFRVPVEYVGRHGSRFVAGDRSLSFAEVFHLSSRGWAAGPGAGAAALSSPALEADCIFEPRALSVAFGVHVCLLAIDRETGEPRVERYACVNDCGAVVDVSSFDNHIRGGIVHGLARVFRAGPLYDPEGQLVGGDSLEASILAPCELPRLMCERTVTPSPQHPLGAKGTGEIGLVGALAAGVNAVQDALRPLGIRDAQLPFTPERLWRLLRGGRSE